MKAKCWIFIVDASKSGRKQIRWDKYLHLANKSCDLNSFFNAGTEAAFSATAQISDLLGRKAPLPFGLMDKLTDDATFKTQSR